MIASVCLIASALVTVAILGWWWVMLAAGVSALAGAAMLSAVRFRRRIVHLVRRTDALVKIGPEQPAGAAGLDRLEANIENLDILLGSVEQRFRQSHPTTGLPTREPLFARIEADIAAGGGGLLGVVAFMDFERVAAFDPALADHAFAVLIDRTARMLGPRPLLAQIDRSRLAIWFGADDAPTDGRSPLDALGYALGSVIRDGVRELLPEIRIGTARHPDQGATPERLLARAIAELSHDAHDGDDALDDPALIARDRYALEQDLRRAVDRGEFELHYQPLIDASARRVCGAEALLRWRHPMHGLIPPGRFVPIMESSGLADEIGLWTLNAACREARGWQRHALGALRVAVNVSGHQLMRGDLPMLVERTLQRHSLGADALEIELTETVATGGMARAAMLLDQLRQLGVAIAIDDFGTGYSSFSTLRTLAFDKIKIDREFVTEVDIRADSQAICRSIIALGKGLGIRVLAEGVERPQEYAWLKAAGCSYFQGYYFAPPLNAEAFFAFVRDTRGLTSLLAPASPNPLQERYVA